MLILIAVAYSNAWAGLEKDAYQTYSIKNRIANNISVEIQTVPQSQIQQACDRESKRVGNQGMGYKVDACSFWKPVKGGFSCTIILPENTNNDTIGHEFRHCFQGNFH